MKLYEFRETKGIDSLMPVERELPKAGPGEVLIRVYAVSLNYRDLLIARGRYLRGLRGADEKVNYRSVPDWDQKVVELTNGIGVDHIIEVGGPGTLGRSMNAVRVGGRISVVGLLTGSDVTVNHPMPILGKQIHVQGVFVGSRDMFEEMNRAISFASASARD